MFFCPLHKTELSYSTPYLLECNKKVKYKDKYIKCQHIQYRETPNTTIKRRYDDEE